MKIPDYILIFTFLFVCCKSETSGSDKVVEQKKEELAFKPYKEVDLSSGSLFRMDDYTSKYIEPRPVDVWLPENYSEDKKYAVLYMHDGQMLFDSTKTWNKQEWMVDEWASKLMTEQKVKDFIVVAPHNKQSIRKSDYFPQKAFESLPRKTRDSLFQVSREQNLTINTVKSDNYLKFIVEELKPLVDKQFSVLSDKDNTAVMGSSMGGLISMYAISEYPEVFGSAACMSTHWIGTYSNINNPIPDAFMNYMRSNLPEASTNRLYFDYGTETLDQKYLKYQDEVTKLLKTKGHHINIKFEGTDHSENSWNKRLDKPLEFLLAKN